MSIKVLIVDDDTAKVRRVAALLREGGVSVDHIQECRSAMDAKSYMSRTKFDLAIVDIVLPDRIDCEPNPVGGIELLRDLVEKRQVLPPGQIVGLTAHRESLIEARALFGSRGWTVLEYSGADDSWQSGLKNILEHVVWSLSASAQGNKSFGVDACVLCALYDPELISVLALPWSWAKEMRSGDHAVYYRGTVVRDTRRISVVAAAAPRMGLPATAAMAAKMISAYAPRYIVMTGIAAGIAGKCELGDILIADSSWDYSSGKFEVDGERGVFSAAPYQIPMDVDTQAKLLELSLDDALLNSIASAWPSGPPRHRLRALLGPVASGGAVVADSNRVEEIKHQQRKLIGIDMETYAIFAAAREAAQPRPLPVSIKSASDFADQAKADGMQRYAAYTSARFFGEFCQTVL